MIRNYKYKIRMNARFRAACETTLEGCRDLYNAALEHRRNVYRQQGKSISWVEQSRELTKARELPEVGALLRSFQAEVIKKVDRSFQAFFRRVKAGQKAGFPRFKGCERYNSFRTIDRYTFRLDGDKLTVLKLGSVRLRLSRPLGGKPKALTIRQGHDGWYAIISCECEGAVLPVSGVSIGIDVGLRSFATLSSGETFDNPRYFQKFEQRLAVAQRRLTRKKNGSLSRRKAKQAVQCIYAKIQRQREWFHWQLARNLIKRFDKIAVEKLDVRSMAEGRFTKPIRDAGWASFINKLVCKAEEAGRQVIKVNPKHTTQDCSGCGKRRKLDLSDRWYSCQCGVSLSRDHNAALNVLARAAPAMASA